MHIAIRVDASSRIGTGHVMRCLTLANEIQKRGATCTFISRHLPTYLQDLITSRQHTVRLIGIRTDNEPIDQLAHASFLGTSQAQDAQQSVEVLQEMHVDWLVIDHYAIDSSWESIARPHTRKILVIDDLADRNHECHLLIDQNLYADMRTRYDEHTSTRTKLLLGPKYAILRSEFRDAFKYVTTRKKPSKRLLISFGGMDRTNYTLPVLQAMSQLQEALSIDVVIGREHPALNQVKAFCEQHSYNCHIQTTRMANLILNADCAIGAGGSSVWERGCLGLPSLAYIVAANQEAQTLHADHRGLLKAGTADISDPVALSIEIQDFLQSEESLAIMHQKCLDSIDVHGTRTIVDHMLMSEIQLRTVDATDAKLLFDWRNHPTTRKASTQSAPINWSSHREWLDLALKDANREIFIAEKNHTPFGVIRFDIQNDQAKISLNLAPNEKGKGLGTLLLLSGEEAIHKQHPELMQFIANVLDHNQASHRLFKRCGYHRLDSQYTKIIRE